MNNKPKYFFEERNLFEGFWTVSNFEPQNKPLKMFNTSSMTETPTEKPT